MTSNNESITIRIDKKLVNRLKRICEEKKMSVNTLCNQILTQYDQWHAHAAKAGMHYYSREFVRLVTDTLSREQLAALARDVAVREIKSRVLLLKGEFTLSAFLDTFVRWLSASNLQFRHEIEDHTHMFVIVHEIGEKWSIYLAEYLHSAIKQFNCREYHIDYTNNTVMLKIDVP
ncbi:MAG: hypothetical protein AB1351_00175 [Thermoproteota archaeon]